MAEGVICSRDPKAHIEIIKKYEKAGYTAVSVHQIGPDHESFFKLYEREVLAAFETVGAR